MSEINYEPVQQTLSNIRTLSTDEEAQHRAFIRQRAIMDGQAAIRWEKKRGREEGEQFGKAETLISQLTTRFGTLDPERTERIRTVSISDLDAWLKQIFDIRSVDDLF